MDRKQMANALMGYADITTADVLNTPIRKGAVLPFTEYADRSEFDLTSGLPGALYNAMTAPARAYRGEISEADMIPEAFNVAGSMTLGNLMSGAAAPVKQRAISAYKAMGPADAPADAMRTARIAGANRFMFDGPDGMEATAFANRRPSTLAGDELLDMLYGSGMGPANSNKATAELFANAKTAAIPGLPMTDGMRLLLADYLGYGNDEGPIY
jgi:hypothetical protein